MSKAKLNTKNATKRHHQLSFGRVFSGQLDSLEWKQIFFKFQYMSIQYLDFDINRERFLKPMISLMKSDKKIIKKIY